MALFNYECDEIKRIIEEVSPNYPQLTTYEKEWLYFHKYGYISGIPVELEYKTVSINPYGSVSNAIPHNYKSAILKGNTKYRDIDTGDILDTFDESKNLEIVSVKAPVLTTTNGDGTKTNILTVNEPVELRGIGEVRDELNLITGELTQRIGEVVIDGSDSFSYIFEPHSNEMTTMVHVLIPNTNRTFKFYNDKLVEKFIYDNTITTEGIFSEWNGLYIRLLNSKLQSANAEGVKKYLQENPITVQYELAQESIKTVDLTKLYKPYEGVNNYYLSANIPCEAVLEVPVVSEGEQTLKEIND